MPEHRPVSEQQRERQRQEVERKIKTGELTKEAGQKVLDSLRSPNVIRE